MSRPKPPIRITVDLTPLQNAKLEEVGVLMDATSKAEVVRNAIKLYDLLQARLSDGTKLYIEKDGVMEQVLVVGLSG